MNKPENVDSYITTFAPQVQELLRQVRKTVLDNAPEAEETISYGMPTFKLHGVLVHYAAFNNHIGFYALPSGNDAFMAELKAYKTGKGSIQFPLEKPLPLDLIIKIVKFRVRENMAKAELKKGQTKKNPLQPGR